MTEYIEFVADRLLIQLKYPILYKSKVSVLLPVYNGSQYLSETIHSILNQTYSDFEIIIIDDASNDNSIEWEDYDGNRMYRTLGNINHNNKISLLFIDLEKPEKKEIPDYPTKLRILGNARIVHIKKKRIISVKISYVFPNCPRYLPSFKFISPSTYLLKKKVPEWKKRNYIKKIL